MIDADELWKAIDEQTKKHHGNDRWHATGIKAMIGCAPTGEAVPVVHGRWISRGRKIECSVCKGEVYLGSDDPGLHEEEKHNFKYCPGCGAKMDGKEQV